MTGFIERSGGSLVHFVDLHLHGETLHARVSDPAVLIHGLACDWGTGHTRSA
jgi:hypothetical protein